MSTMDDKQKFEKKLKMKTI